MDTNKVQRFNPQSGHTRAHTHTHSFFHVNLGWLVAPWRLSPCFPVLHFQSTRSVPVHPVVPLCLIPTFVAVRCLIQSVSSLSLSCPTTFICPSEPSNQLVSIWTSPKLCYFLSFKVNSNIHHIMLFQFCLILIHVQLSPTSSCCYIHQTALSRFKFCKCFTNLSTLIYQFVYLFTYNKDDNLINDTHHSSHSSEQIQRCDPQHHWCWLADRVGCRGQQKMPFLVPCPEYGTDQTTAAWLYIKHKISYTPTGHPDMSE